MLIDFMQYTRVLPLVLLPLLGAFAGCERIALVGRESLKLRPAEVVVEVERVDPASREIYLRPNTERISVVTYSDNTQVLYRGHEHPVENLQAGDVVAMHIKEDSSGRFHSDFMSIRERSGERRSAR
jgi:hypothetical protein